jgi:hypothetical protein
LIAAVSVLCACGSDSGGDRAATRAPQSPDVVRNCRSHVEGRIPGGWKRDAVVVGSIGFYETRSFADAPHPNPGARFVDQKTIVIVRAGSSVTVSVPPVHRRDASLDYGYGTEEKRRRQGPTVRLSDGVRSVRFVACPRGTGPITPGHPLDRETQFNGGIVTKWRQCLTLDVFEPGREEPRQAVISMGAGRCSAPG